MSPPTRQDVGRAEVLRHVAAAVPEGARALGMPGLRVGVSVLKKCRKVGLRLTHFHPTRNATSPSAASVAATGLTRPCRPRLVTTCMADGWDGQLVGSMTQSRVSRGLPWARTCVGRDLELRIDMTMRFASTPAVAPFDTAPTRFRSANHRTGAAYALGSNHESASVAPCRKIGGPLSRSRWTMNRLNP